jgi:1-deoxy-D-xylulose 5-phosphate reductoisomerase
MRKRAELYGQEKRCNPAVSCCCTTRRIKQVNNSVNSAIEAALRMQNERLAALQVVALSLTSTLDLDQVLARVVEFGKARLCQLLREQRRASAGAMVAALEQALREFVGSAPQFDDITAVVVKREE